MGRVGVRGFGRRLLWGAYAEPIELAFLAVFLLTLPQSESLKEIALWGFLLTVGLRLWRQGQARALDALEWTVLGLLLIAASSSIAAALSDATGGGLEKLKNGRYALGAYLLFLATYRGGYTPSARRWMFVPLILGALYAGLYGEWAAAAGRWRHPHLGLIGGSTSSAAYLAIVVGTGIGLAASEWRRMNPLLRGGLCVALVSLVVVVVDMSSRGALFALALLLALIGLLSGSRRLLWIILAGSMALGGWLIIEQPKLTQKFATRMEFASVEGILGPRWEIWRVALEAGLRNPVFGLGPGNYELQDANSYGLDLPIGSEALHPIHAHHVLLGQFAEQGLPGVLGLTLFLCLVGVRIWRSWPPASDASCTLWFGALATFVVVVVAGQFVTTLDFEKGLLAFALFGLTLAPDRQASTAGAACQDRPPHPSRKARGQAAAAFGRAAFWSRLRAIRASISTAARSRPL